MRKKLAALVACLALAACAQEPTRSCPSGSFSCGDPAGGPECCRTGYNCCFGHGTCCSEDYPHLGLRHSDSKRMCYQSLNGEGSTWTLLTVCGVPAP
jgi:hypothetical protein